MKRWSGPMARRVIAAGALVVASVALTACSGGNDGNGLSSPGPKRATQASEVALLRTIDRTYSETEDLIFQQGKACEIAAGTLAPPRCVAQMNAGNQEADDQFRQATQSVLDGGVGPKCEQAIRKAVIELSTISGGSLKPAISKCGSEVSP